MNRALLIFLIFLGTLDQAGTAAGIYMAMLHSNAEFLEDMRAAKAEFARLTK